MKKNSSTNLPLMSILLLLFIMCHSICAQNSYRIYPTPQKITQGSKSLKIGTSIHICSEIGIDQSTRNRAIDILKNAGYTVTESSDTVEHLPNLILAINLSNEIGDRYATKQSIERAVFAKGPNKFDPHVLSVIDDTSTPKIVILGDNTTSVFYGLASLEQMIEQSPKNELSNAAIQDFSYQQIRGFVEGFYGFPWYIRDKVSLMRYAMRFKMNYFIYGPKSDPYHLGYWKNDYPTSLTEAQEHKGWLSQSDLRNLTAESRATKVHFVWAAHPALQNGINFQTTAGADQGITDLMKKFEHLYTLGVRDFGVFVDDISVDDAVRDRVQHKYLMNQLHTKLTQKYNTPQANPTDTIRALHFVPTPYPISWGSATQRKQYFDEIKQIHPSIAIYHTGWGVWSNIEKNPFTTNNAECGRTTSMWWNYPCNDDGHNKMKMGPINQLFSIDNSITQAQGIVANPMTQPQCSKVALFGLADYCWNTPRFDAKKNWENSFKSLVPDDENLRKALRLFALHSSENKEPQSITDLYNLYKNSPTVENPLVTLRLLKQIDSVRWAYTELQKMKESNLDEYQLMYRDIRPWLNKLNAMATTISLTLAAQQETNDPQNRVALFTRAHEIYQQIEENQDHKLEKLIGYGTGTSIEITTAIPSNIEMKGFAKHVQEKSAKTICNELPLAPNAQLISNISTLTGCSLVNEAGIASLNANGFTLLPNQYIGINLNQLKRIETITIHNEIATQVEMQISTNGKEWIGITSDTPTPYAAYIRLYNNKTTNASLTLNKDRFAASFAAMPKIEAATQNTSAGIHEGTIQKTYDGDLNSVFWTNNVMVSGDRFTYDLGKPMPIYDVTVTFKGNDRPGEAKIQGSLNELIAFKDLGTPMTAANMQQTGNLYSHTTKADGTPSRYVRLYITSPNGGYWLQFAEIEINRQHIASSILSQDIDDKGTAIHLLSDRNMMTAYKPSSENQFVDYSLIKNERPQTITIYQNPDAIEGKNAPKVTALSGKEWIELGNLEEAIQTFNLSNLSNLHKIRIQWQPNEAPSLYEIVEKGTQNDEEILNLDEIQLAKKITWNYHSGKYIVLSNQPISQITLFDCVGKIENRWTVNAHTHSWQASKTQSISIVQIQLSDGTIETIKVMPQ